MDQSSPVEMALSRDRLIVAGGLVAVTILAWSWTLAGIGMAMIGHGAGLTDSRHGLSMPEMIGAAAMTPAAWSPSYAVLMVVMWWVMMIAMMLPSAAPLILLATALYRRKRPGARPDVMAGALAAGYLAVWGAFSLIATLAQWGLELISLISPATMAAGPALAGAILLAAGLYQLTPLKQGCLRHCCSPVAFLTTHWPSRSGRHGPASAFELGLAHGAYCLGCCWFLMTLLFVGGVMNLLWIGGLAIYVLMEKFAPGGGVLSRASGLMLTGAGIVVLVGSVWQP